MSGGDRGVSTKIAIVGGGMAGLSCATALARKGIASTILDKGRGPGGRMATRRADIGGRELRFDHGAQFFTARDDAFITQCAQWQDAGVVAPWLAAGTGAMVGTPAMNAPLRHMAEPLDVRWGQRIDAISFASGKWSLDSQGDRLDSFTHLVVALPAEQAAVMLEPVATAFAQEAASSVSEPCWAVMALFARPLKTPGMAILGDVIREPGADISWAARNGAKPGRAGDESWVIHASPEFSLALLDQSADAVAQAILARFFAETGAGPADPTHLAAHRWLYAKVLPVAGAQSRWDAAMCLGVTGDWLVQPRVEGAWLSGHDLATRIAASLDGAGHSVDTA